MKEFKGYKDFVITTDDECSDTFYMQPAPTFGAAEHNSILFEAAPKMLEELQEIVEYINKMGVVSMAMNRIKHRAITAINKALGDDEI